MIKLRFAIALIVAAAYYLLEEMGNARLAIRAAFSCPEVDRELTERRLAVCRGCPLYYAPLQTCGSPLARKTWASSDEPEGCFCFLPIKAQTKCNCWLSDQTQGKSALGWQGELNSFPHGS